MRILIVIWILALATSCTSRTIYKKPDDLISKKVMIDLWTDIYIANSAKSVKNQRLERKINYMPFIYQKYKIDSARFMRSNVYYTSKIETYEEMFREVEQNLIAIRDSYDPEMKGIDPNLPIWKRDSLKKVNALKKNEEPEILLKKTKPIEKIND